MLPNNSFTFNQRYQLVSMFGPRPNLFRPITELARPFPFPLSVTSSILSFCSLNYGTRWSAQSYLPWAIRTQERSPSLMRRRVLVLVRV
jgi:hypothetical protein